MPRTAQITARVEPELKSALEYVSKKQGISVAQAVINAITAYIQKWG